MSAPPSPTRAAPLCTQFSPLLLTKRQNGSSSKRLSPIVRGISLPQDVDAALEINSAVAVTAAAAAESGGGMYKPSALDDGTLVCVRCHEILDPAETLAHDSTCEVIREDPTLINTASSAQETKETRRRCADAVEELASKASRSERNLPAQKVALGANASSLQPQMTTKFSISDIQNRWRGKGAVLLQKSGSDQCREASTGASAGRSEAGKLPSSSASAARPCTRGQRRKHLTAAHSQSTKAPRTEMPACGDTSSSASDAGDRDGDQGSHSSDTSSSDSDVVFLPSCFPDKQRKSGRSTGTAAAAALTPAAVKRQRTSEVFAQKKVQSKCARTDVAATKTIDLPKVNPRLQGKAAAAPLPQSNIALRSILATPSMDGFCAECGLAGGFLQVNVIEVSRAPIA